MRLLFSDQKLGIPPIRRSADFRRAGFAFG